MDYLNKKLRRVKYEDLIKVLKDKKAQHDANRRSDQQDLAKALSDGFICTGGRPNIKPLL
jgi:hypothetical protein